MDKVIFEENETDINRHWADLCELIKDCSDYNGEIQVELFSKIAKENFILLGKR